MPATKTADLCEDHYNALVVIKERLKPKKKKKKLRIVRSKIDFATLNPQVLEIADKKPFFTATEVSRALNIGKYTAERVVRELVDQRFLDSTGTGAGRKLSKAS